MPTEHERRDEAFTTLIDLCEARSHEDGGYLLVDGEQDLPFEALFRRAKGVAAALMETGAPGDRVALALGTGAPFLIGLFGSLLAGQVAVPLPAPASAAARSRVAGVLRVAEPTRVVVSPEHVAATRAEGWPACPIEALVGDPETWRRPPTGPERPAILQFSSGSTGDPRGVVLTHANVLHNERAIYEAFGLSRGCEIVGWLPLHHDMGLIGNVLQTLYAGGRCALMAPETFVARPAVWLEWISRRGAQVSGGPDFAYRMCTRQVPEEALGALDLSRWRVAYSGAERVLPATLAAFAARFARCGFRSDAFLPCYGLAEATLLVSAGPPGPPRLSDAGGAGSFVSCGRPARGVTLHVANGDVPAAEGEIGEIRVSGPSVAAGYAGNPQASAERFGPQGGQLRTGDLGFLRGGELFLTGRLADRLVLRGRNVFPEDVESAVGGAHAALRASRCAAVATREEAREGAESLVVLAEVDRGLAEAALREVAFAARNAVVRALELEPPRVVLVAPDALDRTTSGKPRRRVWHDRWRAGTMPVLYTLRPEPEPEARGDGLERILSSVLGPLAPDRPLVAQGLDSIRAIQLAHRLEVELGLRIEARALLGDLSPDALRRAGPGEARVPSPPVAATDRAPLTEAEQALWTLDATDPEAPVHTLFRAFEVHGRLSPAQLRRAVGALLDAHPVLRAALEDGEPLPSWRVLERPMAPVFPRSLRGRDDLERTLRAAAGRRMELQAELPLRVDLWELPDGAQVLGLTLHHLAADLWSVDIIIDDLDRTLEGVPLAASGPERLLDRVARERAYLAGEDAAGDLRWWTGALDGIPALPARAGASDPRARRPHLTRATTARLGRARTAALEQEAGRLGVTLHAALLAAFGATLGRRAGEPRLRVGTVLAGRDDPADAGQVGCFVRAVALPIALTDQPDLPTLSRTVGRLGLEAMAHGRLPTGRLVGALRAGGDADPLARAMFVLQQGSRPWLSLGTAGGRIRLGPVELRALEQTTRWSIFDVALTVGAEDDGLVAVLELPADEAEDGEAAAILGDWLATLDALGGAGADPPARGPERIPSRLDGGPALDTEPLLATVARLVRTRPDEIAATDPDRVRTWRQIGARAGWLASRLGPGQVVALAARRDADLLAWILGVLASGATLLALDPSQPAARLDELCGRAGAGLRVGYAGLNLPGTTLELPGPDADLGASPDLFTRGPPPAGPPAVAFVSFTSGSTGAPRPVWLTLRAFEALLAAGRAMLPCDRLILPCLAPAAFDIALFELLLPASAGGVVDVLPSGADLDPALVLGRLHRYSVLHAVPVLMRELARLRDPGAPSPRWLLVGGDRVPSDLLAAMADAFPGAGIRVLYGPTEGTVLATSHLVTAPGAPHELVIGLPLPGVQVQLLDERGAPAVEGEIALGGEGVALGYGGMPGLTAAAFLPDPWSEAAGARLYRTGDHGRVGPDGALRFLGRRDRQIKIAGSRIEPAEVEAALRRCAGVLDAVVAARAVGGATRLYAWVTAASSAKTLDPARIRAQLAARLPAPMVPRAVAVLPAFPLSANGKIDLAALPTPEAGAAGSDPVGADPAAARREREMAALWAEILGRPVGPEDDFYSLGGDSVGALQLSARCRVAGAAVSPRMILSNPTVRGLLGALGEADAAPVPPPERPPSLPRVGDVRYLGQALRVPLPAGLDAAQVEGALARIVGRHEALQGALGGGGGGGGGVSASPPAALVIRIDGEAAPDVVADALLAEIDPGRPPLIRAAILEGPPRGLVLVAHHLAVDVTSWRVLLDELTLLLEDPGFSLPPAPSPGPLVMDLSAQVPSAADLGLWRDLHALPPLRVKPGVDTGTRTVRLGEVTTGHLLDRIARAGMRLEEAIVAALAWAVQGGGLRVGLETDLRADAAVAGAARTVGWFGAVVPVALPATPGDLDEALEATRRRVREVLGRAPTLAGARAMDAAIAGSAAHGLVIDHLGALTGEAEPLGLRGVDRVAPVELTTWLRGGLVMSWSYLGVDGAEAGRLIEGVLAALHALGTPGIASVQPLTPLQEGLHAASLRAGAAGARVYIERLCLELRGELDTAAIQAAWQDLARAHASLRLSVATGPEGAYHAHISATVALPLSTHDLSALPDRDREERREALLTGEEAALDPARAPLHRLALLRLGPDHHELWWTHAHLLLDGWSFGILLPDLARAYAARARGEAPQLEGSPSFRAFARQAAAPPAPASLRWWRDQLQGRAGYRIGSPASGPPRHAEQRLTLGPQETAALLRWAGERRQSVAAVICGVWGLLLRQQSGLGEPIRSDGLKKPAEREALRGDARGRPQARGLTGQDSHEPVSPPEGEPRKETSAGNTSREARVGDVVFGVVSSGRGAPIPDVQRLVGLAAHVLPLWVGLGDAPPDATVGEMLGRTADLLAAVEAHDVADLARLARLAGSSAADLFDTVVTVENYPLRADVDFGPALRLEGASLLERSHYALDLIVHTGAELDLRLVRDDARVSEDRARRLLHALGALLRGLPDLAGRPAEEIAGGLADRAALLALGTGPVVAAGPDFVEAFTARVAAHPDRTALSTPGQRWTYADLWARALAVAGAIRAAGGGPESLVALLAHRGPSYVAAVIGVQAAGAAWLPLDPEHPPARLAEVLDGMRPPLALVDETCRALADRAFALCAAEAPRGLPLELDAPAGPSPLRSAANALAYVLMTSGSTGRPKGAAVDRAGLSNLLWAKIGALSLGPDDVVAQTATPCFDISIWQMLSALMVGARVHLVPPAEVRDPARLLPALVAGGVGVLELVPTQIRLLLEQVHATPESASILRGLRCLVSTGEPLPPDLLAAWFAVAPEVPVLNAYGPTECSKDATHHWMRQAEDPVAIGRPFDNITTQVLGPDLALLPRGAVGEIAIGGVAVGRGYHRDPARTAAVFVPDPYGAPGARLYRTGDLGRWREDGALLHLGRADRQIKLHGRRIEPGEIEAQLRALPGVADAHVGLDTRSSPRLVAFVVPRDPSAPPTPARLRAGLAERLDPHLLPAEMVLLGALPQLPSGKLDGRALPWPRRAEGGEGSSDEERALEALWEAVLQTGPVGLDDDFLERGGDSVLAVRLAARARARGLSLEVEDVFTAPTVRAQAALIRARGAAGAAPPPAEAPEPAEAEGGDEAVPLTPLQRGLVFEAQLSGGGAYVEQLVCGLAGGPSGETWARAFTAVLARHPLLRASFLAGGEALRIGAAATIPFARTTGELAAFLAADRERGFALDEPPLMRLTELRDGEARHLIWTHHHLLLDATSLATVLGEVIALCAAFAGASPASGASRLPPSPPLQAHLRWARARADTAADPAWAAMLGGLSRPTPVPGARAALPGAAVGRSLRLPIPAVEALSAAAGRMGVTLSALLCGAWASVLATESADLVFGLTLEGREGDPPLPAGQVGLYVNTLPLRVPTRRGPPGAWLREIQRRIATLHRLSASSLAALRAHTAVPPGVPLFESFFNIHRPRVLPPAPSELGVVSIHWEERTRFTLMLEVDRDQLHLRYDERRLDPEAARHLGERLLETARALAGDDPDRVEEDEGSWPWHLRFEARVREDPDAVALIEEGRGWTRAELDSLARATARRLRSAGVGLGDTVAVVGGRSAATAAAALAVAKSGAAFFVLDAALGAAQPDLPRRAGARLTLGAPIAGAGLPHLPLDGAVDIEDLTPLPSVSPPPEAPAWLIHTSGSSGRPRVVVGTHRGLSTRLAWTERALPFAPDERLGVRSSVRFVDMIAELLQPLVSGIPGIILPDGTDVERLVARIQETGVTRLVLVPSLLRALLDLAPPEAARDDWLGGLRILTCSGEALDPALRDRAQAALPRCRLLNIYGSAEVSADATWARTDPRDGPIVPLGQPLHGCEARVLGPDLRPCPVGAVGEIHVSGEGLTLGYRGDPGRTACRFLPDPFAATPGARMFATGDLARVLPDGGSSFVGRADLDVKIRGQRVSLAEVEQALLRQPGVADAAAARVSDPNGDPALAAWLVADGAARAGPRPSLFFFAEGPVQAAEARYRLVLDAARRADDAGFHAIWVPERHFTEVAGNHPNPSVLAAALAMCTRRVGLRAGSVVLPLHHPARVAEEWAVVDNLSGGRVGISFTAGWVPMDYALAPEAYAARRERTLEGVAEVRALWRGEAITRVDGLGEAVALRTLPRPMQPELPAWLTCTGRPEAFVRAGELGLNVLTALIAQPLEVAAENIRLYRQARARVGLDPATGQVTLMIHALVGPRGEEARALARTPLRDYLRAHAALMGGVQQSLGTVEFEAQDLESVVELSAERYLRTASLIGSVDEVRARAAELGALGVDELACLIDFCPAGLALAQLPWLLGALSPRPSEATLRAGLAGLLPAEALPSRLRWVEALPRNASGKLDRSRLGAQEPAWASPTDLTIDPGPGVPAREPSVAEPDGEVDAALVGRIAAMFGEVLGRPIPSPDADFFALGGHSLTAVRLLARLRRELDAQLPLEILFEAPTVAALARRVARAARPGAGQVARIPGPSPAETPLTPAQRQIWLAAILDPSGAAYNESVLMLVPGQADRPGLEAALAALAARHAPLRARFLSGAAGLSQRYDAPPIAVGLERAPDLPAGLARAAAAAKVPFDLKRGPPARALLIALPEDRHLALFTLHLLAADGASWRLMLDEIDALLSGAGLPALLEDFPTYAATQQFRADAAATWADHLLPLPRPLPLPDTGDAEAAGVRVALGPLPDLARSLGELAREGRSSLFAAGLAAWGVLLWRYCGVEDLLCGAPFDRRDRAELLGMVGCMVHTLPLRLRPRPDRSFRDLVVEAGLETRLAHGHADATIEDIRAELARKGPRPDGPLLSTLFLFEADPVPPPRLGGREATPLPLPDPAPKAALVCALARTPGDGLRLELVADARTLDEAGARALLSLLAHTLEDLCASPEVPIGELWRAPADEPPGFAFDEEG